MKNLDIFLEANQALANGNYDKFISYCTEDIKWESVGEETFYGKQELFRYVSSTYQGLMFTTEKTIEAKNELVELGQITFKFNGVSKKSSYCDIWNFKDGLVSRVTSFVI